MHVAATLKAGWAGSAGSGGAAPARERTVMMRSGRPREARPPTEKLTSGAVRPSTPSMMPQYAGFQPNAPSVKMGRPSMYACEARRAVPSAEMPHRRKPWSLQTVILYPS